MLLRTCISTVRGLISRIRPISLLVPVARDQPHDVDLARGEPGFWGHANTVPGTAHTALKRR